MATVGKIFVMPGETATPPPGVTVVTPAYTGGGGGGRARTPSDLVRQASIQKALASARAKAQVEADRKRLQELEDIRTRNRLATEQALTQTQLIEFQRLQRSVGEADTTSFMSLSREERRRLTREAEVRALRDRLGPDVKLDPRLERAGRRIDTRTSLTKDAQRRQGVRVIEIDTRTGKPFGRVTAVKIEIAKDQPQLRGSFISKIFPTPLLFSKETTSTLSPLLRGQRSISQTESLRRGGEFKIVPEITAFGIGAGTSVLGTLEFGQELVDKPITTIKETVIGIGTIGKKFFTGQLDLSGVSRTIKQEPSFALGFLGAEVGQDILFGKAVKTVGDIVDVGRTRLSPKFTPVIDDVIKIRKGEGFFDIKLTGGLSTIDEPLSLQAKLAGQRVTGVSGARDLFGTIRKRTITVDKPLPFPDAPPLERAFFADPRGRLRVSRLGILEDVKGASLSDILSGDITFKRRRPQAIVFPDVKVADFPKDLSDIGKKLRAGKELTPSEQARLLKFQLTPTGEFKPIGFLSKEPEIVLAPTEILKRDELLGVTIIKGKRVEIIGARIGGASEELAKLQRKTQLTTKESQRLQTLLVRETRISPPPSTARFSSPTGVSGQVVLSAPPSIPPLRLNQLSFTPSVQQVPSFISPTPSIPSKVSPTPTKRQVSPTPRLISPLITPRRRVPLVPSLFIPRPRLRPTTPLKRFTPFPRTKPRRQPTEKPAPQFTVFVRRRGEFRPIGTGLTLGKAFAVGRQRVSRTLAATFKVTGPKGFRPITPVGFRAKPTKEGILFIERRGLRLSTTPETKEIQVAKRLKGGRR